VIITALRLLLFHRLCFLGPIVQVVGNVVALAAGRELLVHPLVVRHAMAVGALHHRLVLVSMAGYASELAVLGFTGRQLGHDVVVTGSAHGRGGVWPVFELQGLVGLMAELAIGLSHRRGVRLVAVDTGRDIAVLVGMTEVAGDGRVLAGLADSCLPGSAWQVRQISFCWPERVTCRGW